MRVLLYGQFDWYRLGASYKRGFEELGHEVVELPVGEAPRYLAPWMRQRLLHRLVIRSLRLRSLGTRRWNQHFLEAVSENRPDFVFVLKGDLLMPGTLGQIRESGAPVLIFHPDNPFPHHSANRPETIPSMSQCDVYFIWSRSLLPQLQAEGARRVEYLPFAWDPVVFPYSRPSNGHRTEFDVVFIGGWDRHREEWLTPLARRFPLKIWGPEYWGTRTRPRSPLRECWQGRAVRGKDGADIIHRSKIALSVFRLQNMPDGVIMRTFEVPGCGGFLLANRTAGATEIFPEDEAGGYFDTMDELMERTAHFLESHDHREEIAKRAHNIVRDHTYTARARQVIDTYQTIR